MTLPELIQAHGDYTTAGFSSIFNFRSHMKQFVRGFEYYVNPTRSPGWLHHLVVADEINDRFLPWLEQHADGDFFAFVHYWDPHGPYNMPDEHRGRFDRRSGDLPTTTAPDGYEYVPGWGLADRLDVGSGNRSIDLYDDEVSYVDEAVRQVCEKLNDLRIWDDTTIVLTGDQCEDLDLHGSWGHGTVHESTIRVPLIVRDPTRGARGQRMSGFVQHADNLPTILARFPQQERPGFKRLAETWMPEIPETFDGRDLSALAEGNRAAADEIVVECTDGRAYIAPPWKLIWHSDGSASELFHLDNDPLELNDRSDHEPSKADELTDKLRGWLERNLRDGNRSEEGRDDPILKTAS